MAGAVVQSRESSTDSTPGSTIALAFSGANTAANNLWVVGHVGNNGNLPTIADSASNTYSARLDTVSDATNNNCVTHWHCTSCAAATPTVTVTFVPGTQPFRCIFIAEISGCQNATNDGHNGQHQDDVGTGTDAVSSGTAANAETAFVLGLSINDSGANPPAAGTGFTSFNTGWGFGGSALARMEYKASLAPATTAATFTAGASTDDTNTVMIKMKETAAAALPRMSPPIMQAVNRAVTF